MLQVKLIVFIIVALTSLSCYARTVDKSAKSYENRRRTIQNIEDKGATGGRIKLSAKEIKANSVLMFLKNKEIDAGLTDPDRYPPGMHFFEAKPLIEKSDIFKIIRKMPKGAFLHGHTTAMVSSEWVIKNLTYRYEVYTCKDINGNRLFTMRQNSNCAPTTPLRRVRQERKRAKDKTLYDEELEQAINLYNKQPEAFVSEQHKIWEKFQFMFGVVGDLYKYAPVFKAVHERILEELYEDNVLYAELRTSLPKLYGDNSIKTQVDVSNLLEEIANNFSKTHPDFIGLKLIYAKHKKSTKEDMAQYVKDFTTLYNNNPNFVMGFDLVGNEDIGDPLHKYVDELSALPTNSSNFFHAGETKWYGKTDWNLLDAILMNTKRIGHGYALPKHPQLWEAVKNKGIGLEINPISNQVLGLVWDLRNHPASIFLAQDLPVVISADDPGFWNAKGLSYDFYYAFMSLSSADADLRTLKQLVLNSIQLSVLTDDERLKLEAVFEKKWNSFLDFLINYPY